ENRPPPHPRAARGGGPPHPPLPATPLQEPTLRAFGRQRHDLFRWEPAFLEHAEHGLPHGPRRTQHRHSHCSPPNPNASWRHWSAAVSFAASTSNAMEIEDVDSAYTSIPSRNSASNARA